MNFPLTSLGVIATLFVSTAASAQPQNGQQQDDAYWGVPVVVQPVDPFGSLSKGVQSLMPQGQSGAAGVSGCTTTTSLSGVTFTHCPQQEIHIGADGKVTTSPREE